MSQFLKELFQVFSGDPNVMRGKSDREKIALMVQVEDLSEGEGPALPSLHHEHGGNLT
jgi:hypothetical protein